MLHQLSLRLQTHFTPPIFPGNEDKTRAAQALDSLLAAITLMLVVIIPLNYLLVELKWLVLAATPVMLFAILLARWALRRGHVRAAGLVFVGLSWLITSVTLIMAHGIASALVVEFLAVLVLARVVLENFTTYLLTAITLVLHLFLVLLATLGALPEQRLISPIGAWFALAISVSFALLPLNSIMRSLSKALAEARQQIEERRKAESRLRESEALFSTAFRNSPVAMSIMRASDRCYMDVNETFLKLIEFQRDEVIGKTSAELGILVVQGTDDAIDQRWARLYSQGRIPNFEGKLRRRSGEIREMLMSVELIHMDGEPVVLTTSIDITERNRSAAQIRALNAQLEQRVNQRTAQLMATNKELESFAYSVSHDLRAPLRAVTGFSNSLNAQYRNILPEPAQHCVERIQANGLRMAQLIDDLLNLSRIGRQYMSYGTVAMRTLVLQVVDELKADEQLAGAELVVGDLPPCRGDTVLLKQVWFNLISNAIKYSQKTAQPHIEIGYETLDDQTAYYVRDNGVGFDMKYAENLFGAFQRLHKAEEYEGTGIGLAIVRRIITRHGGRVWAQAEVNKGATFYFVIGNEPEVAEAEG